MRSLEEIVTDKRLDDVFQYANFGGTSKRDVVKWALMKVACRYANGHTAECIIIELGLVGKDLILTDNGREYLYEAFNQGGNH